MKVFINNQYYCLNYLEEIDTIVPPEEITILNIELCKLKVLPEDAFRNYTNLKILELLNNEIEQLTTFSGTSLF